MYSLIRPLFFKMEPEQAHDLALSILSYIPKICFRQAQSTTPIKAMGLDFPHAIGLAAGLDKNGEYLDGLAKIGFSFIEVGTVTPKPQDGNPKPRLFRLPEAQAIINRMGFNNKGVDALVKNIEHANYKGILGINIGKNKETPLELASEDYLYCLQQVYPYASYVTINISSPNTPELRQLQQKEYLGTLLAALHEEQMRLSDEFQRHVPLVVKVSPDEEDETLKGMTEVMLHHGIEGLIATNTTCSRVLVKDLPYAEEEGGLSGKPLTVRSTQCLRLLKRYVGDAMTLIGVGGVDSHLSAQSKLTAGASLLQVYTGLVYHGPELIRRLVSDLDVK